VTLIADRQRALLDLDRTHSLKKAHGGGFDSSRSSISASRSVTTIGPMARSRSRTSAARTEPFLGVDLNPGRGWVDNCRLGPEEPPISALAAYSSEARARCHRLGSSLVGLKALDRIGRPAGAELRLNRNVLR